MHAGDGQGARPVWRPWLADAAGVAVVCLVLLAYGVLQERIMTVGFGRHSELFDSSIFLVLCNRLCTCALAVGWMLVTRQPVRPAAPINSYAAVSFTNVVATSCQYEALKYVSFAIQTLAKSAKAMPVMIWSTVFSGRRYKPSEYVHATLITVGCTVFVLTGSVASRVVDEDSSHNFYAIGALLMLMYLGVDGLTSTWQDNLFTSYNVSVCDQVLFTTSWSTLLSLVATVATNQLVPSIRFVMRHTDALWWIMALSVCSAAMQIVISYTIKRYGAVVFATIMTTRQFFSVLLSSIVFWTPLTIGQWVGLVIVFSTLYYKLASRSLPGKPHRGRGAKTGSGVVLSPAMSPEKQGAKHAVALAEIQPLVSAQQETKVEV